MSTRQYKDIKQMQSYKKYQQKIKYYKYINILKLIDNKKELFISIVNYSDNNNIV